MSLYYEAATAQEGVEITKRFCRKQLPRETDGLAALLSMCDVECLDITHAAKGVVMNAQSQLKLDIITKVDQGKIFKENACKLLNKSMRTIERYLFRYRKERVTFVHHKNKGISPINKTSDEKKQLVQSLIKGKYRDFNLTHLREKLLEEESIENIKRETLRKWAMKFTM